MTMIYSHNSANGCEACLFLKNYFIVFVFYDRDLFHHHLSFSQAYHSLIEQSIFACVFPKLALGASNVSYLLAHNFLNDNNNPGIGLEINFPIVSETYVWLLRMGWGPRAGCLLTSFTFTIITPYHNHSLTRSSFPVRLAT